MDEYKKKSNSGDDVFVSIQPSAGQTPPPPTAVVLGWLSSKPKHVAKYAKLYQDMRYNIVQTTASHSVVFPLTMRTTAIYFLSVLRILASDDRLTAGGVVFHVFSNGGAIVAPFLSTMFHLSDPDKLGTLSAFPKDFFNFVKSDNLIDIEKVKKSHAAMVFDSAPVSLRISLGWKAIVEGLGLNDSILSYVIAFFFTAACLIQRVFICNLPHQFWTGIRNASYVCPELYIYSRMDHLLDVTSLEALIKERAQKGKNVRVWDVDDAEHVSLLRKYPDKYREVVQSVNDWGTNEWRKRNSLPDWTFESEPSVKRSD